MKKKLSYTLFCMMLVLGLLLTACGSAAEPDTTEPEVPEAEVEEPEAEVEEPAATEKRKVVYYIGFGTGTAPDQVDGMNHLWNIPGKSFVAGCFTQKLQCIVDDPAQVILTWQLVCLVFILATVISGDTDTMYWKTKTRKWFKYFFKNQLYGPPNLFRVLKF